MYELESSRNKKLLRVLDLQQKTGEATSFQFYFLITKCLFYHVFNTPNFLSRTHLIRLIEPTTLGNVIEVLKVIKVA